MTNRLSNLRIFVALAFLLSTPAFAADGVKINEVVVAASIAAAQRDAMYGSSANAPAHTSGISEVQAEAKQKALIREKQQQDALNSDTVAIDATTNFIVAVVDSIDAWTIRLDGRSRRPSSRSPRTSVPNS